MKVFALIAALFVATVAGSGLIENRLIHSERFGHALFREGGALAAPIYRNDLIHPITYNNYDGIYHPYAYDGTYHHAPLDAYNYRTYTGPYDFRSEAITADLRYNLPYGYARHF
ncbi:uncharacterized protein LOC132257579 [Phlebotomus argentipes]|uniref:uncharacterized protein LOC132257579 n=1 Tax=Phlebotomus argentipes TaxID=94469 RepID=UPI0028932CA9|nr:uncharacterized protein LOC132257579 [Phlebotomus argentipes]